MIVLITSNQYSPAAVVVVVVEMAIAAWLLCRIGVEVVGPMIRNCIVDIADLLFIHLSTAILRILIPIFFVGLAEVAEVRIDILNRLSIFGGIAEVEAEIIVTDTAGLVEVETGFVIEIVAEQIAGVVAEVFVVVGGRKHY